MNVNHDQIRLFLILGTKIDINYIKIYKNPKNYEKLMFIFFFNFKKMNNTLQDIVNCLSEIIQELVTF